MSTIEIAVRESAALQEIIAYGLEIEGELYGGFPGGQQAFFTRAEKYVASHLEQINFCEANKFKANRGELSLSSYQPKNRKLNSDESSHKKIIARIQEDFPGLRIVRHSFFEKLVYCAYIRDLEKILKETQEDKSITPKPRSFSKSRTEQFSQEPLEMIMTLVRLLQKCETWDDENNNDNRVAKVIGRILEGWENGSFSGYDFFYDEMTSAGFTEETISEVWD